jgi:hypothetical protein
MSETVEQRWDKMGWNPYLCSWLQQICCAKLTLRIYWLVVVVRQFRNSSTILWWFKLIFNERMARSGYTELDFFIHLVSSLFCLNFWYSSYERMKVQFCNLWPLMLKYTQANIYVWKTHSMLSSTITLFSLTVSIRRATRQFILSARN